MPVLSCLFAALIAAGAYMAIPLPGSPVPIVLQNMFILAAALVLGPVWGLAATAIYLLMGAIGLPVFAGGSGGIARFAGPTGGYLVGYLPAVAAAGILARAGQSRFWKHVLAGLVGTAIVYLCGVTWLKFSTKAAWTQVITTGVAPFLVWDIAKVFVAALVASRIAGRIRDIDPYSGFRR